MATEFRLRRGTTAQHSTFTGAPAEVTVDTNKNTAVVHDGVTAGGFPLARDSALVAHTGNTSNPHGVTKAQVGLGNVDNTSDADKPISTATQTALNGKADSVHSHSWDGITGKPEGAFSLRNKIINGAMAIAQRGTSKTGLGVSNEYILDRFRPSAAGISALLTISQETDAPAGSGLTYSMRATVTTADASVDAGDRFSLIQVIEGYNISDLVNRAFTLSFWVRSPKAGTHCVAFGHPSGNTFITEYTVNAANIWEKKTITVSGGLPADKGWYFDNRAGLFIHWVLMAGTSFQAAPNTWHSTLLPASSAQVNCLDTVDNIFAITGVQLEAGSVATPFEHRPVGLELSLCERYFEVTASTARFYSSGVSQHMNTSTPFKVIKRAVPTLTNRTNTSNLASDNNLTTDNVYGFRHELISSGAGDCYSLHQIVWASAEL